MRTGRRSPSKSENAGTNDRSDTEATRLNGPSERFSRLSPEFRFLDQESMLLVFKN